MKQTVVIAEAGVNHNGDIAMAHRLIDAAKASGADVVKFQTFKSTDGISRFAEKAAYQKKTTASDESQLDMVRKLELPFEAFLELKRHCGEIGIEFLTTPFDPGSVTFVHSLKCNRWKIPSGEITNLPHLRRIGAFGEPVLLSTGMASLGEIDAALTILEDSGCPRSSVTLFHCTTEYPAPPEDANLSAMRTMLLAFPGIAGVGYSDHTAGIDIPVAAVAMGAVMIEKHFTLDCDLEGPDHKASLEPQSFADMVHRIRIVESALGDGIKRPATSECPNRSIARKSLVAARPIARGELFSPENMAVKRPGTGVSPMRWDEYVGKAAERDYAMDEQLC